MSCSNCEQEMIDPEFQWAEDELLECGCCAECGCDCEGWARVADKHMKRTGVFRIYCYESVRQRGRLKLEVVLRGKVLFTIPLWSIKPMM